MNVCGRPCHRLTIGIIIALTVATLFGSCSAPFTADILARAEDQTAPVVTVTSPENESYYAKTVTVTGTVADATNTEEVVGAVVSLRYEIPAAAITDDVEIGAEGEFTFSFSTTAFTGGTISVRVVATDSNGNEGVASRSLLYGGSDIATFEAVPGNQRVTLRWDPVSTATGYTVKNLGDAEVVVLDPSASSHTWEGLHNGELYFFQLEATDESGETNLSSEVLVIPLSPYTLLPNAYSYDDRVLVTWRSMPGVTTYVVEKALSIDGPYLKRFQTSDTQVEDTLLARDQYYYYRIYPESQDQIKSAPVEAVLLPFSVTGTEPGNYFGPLVDTQMVRGYGNYVIINDRDTDGFSYIRVLDASDPANLVEVGNLNTGTPTYLDMVVDEIEQLLYISIEEEGVLVVDISNPASPSLVTLTVPAGRFLGEPNGTLGDIYSFNALGITRGPSNTFIVGLGYNTYIYSARVDRSGNNIALTATASAGPFGDPIWDGSKAMAIHGNTAYVSYHDASAAESGFRLYDVSDPVTSIPSVPGAPALVSGNSPGNAIAVTDDYVFLEYLLPSPTQYFVRVLDVSDSYNQIATYEFPVRVQQLTLANDTLYVSAGSSGVHGFDVSSPPAGTGATPVVVPDMAGPAYGSVVQGDYLVVAGLTGVESFHLLPAIGYGSVKNLIGGYVNMKDFATIGNRAHVLGLGSSFPPSTAGFYTADLTSPETLPSLNLVSGLDGGSQVILQGDREMLFSTSLDTVRFISPPSVSDPVVASEFIHNARELYSIGDVTYGIRLAIVSIYDTSDGNDVTQIRSIGFDNNIIELAARGDYMYAAYMTDYGTRSSGIIVLDISDPVYPTEVYRIVAEPNIGFHDMELFGDELYVPYSDDGGSYQDGTDDTSGLRIYSLAADPEEPLIVGTPYADDSVFSALEDWSKRFEHVEVRGHLVALSSGQSANSTRYKGRVVLVNVSDPDNIVKVKDVLPDLGHELPGTTPDFPQAIHFWRGAYLFVMGRNGLTVYQM